MVYARTIDDTQLTLIVSGKLWRNSMIMQDEETGSLWSHVTGECLEGQYQGKTLLQVPSVQTTWAEWQAAHPQTRVLKKPGEIKSSRYQSYFDDPDRAGLYRAFWLHDRMPAKALVHGLANGVHAAAVIDTSLAPGSSRVFDLGGIQVKVERDTAGGVRAVEEHTGQEMLVRTAFWFAWSSFYPNTMVVE